MEQFPHGYPAQPAGPAQTPGRAAAIATIILSFLGVIAGLIAAAVIVLAGSFIASKGNAGELPVAMMVVIGLVSVAYAALLCVGAVLLIKHRLAGRHLVVAGTVLAILVAVVPIFGWSSFSIREVIGPVVTLVCALLPGTRDWCVEHGRPQTWEH